MKETRKESLDLIEKGESQEIDLQMKFVNLQTEGLQEFKESLKLRDEIGQIVSSFSNTNNSWQRKGKSS